MLFEVITNPIEYSSLRQAVEDIMNKKDVNITEKSVESEEESSDDDFDMMDGWRNKKI